MSSFTDTHYVPRRGLLDQILTVRLKQGQNRIVLNFLPLSILSRVSEQSQRLPSSPYKLRCSFPCLIPGDRYAVDRFRRLLLSIIIALMRSRIALWGPIRYGTNNCLSRYPILHVGGVQRWVYLCRIRSRRIYSNWYDSRIVGNSVSAGVQISLRTLAKSWVRSLQDFSAIPASALPLT